jgi:hypothetical protein
MEVRLQLLLTPEQREYVRRRAEDEERSLSYVIRKLIERDMRSESRQAEAA